MWKRNLAIGLTVVLTITTICFGSLNYKQQKRISSLEQVRQSTTEQVRTEIDNYFKKNAISFVTDAADQSGKATEDIISDAIGGVIKDTEDGKILYMELSDAQIEMLAADLAEITYESLSADVLAGKQNIDVTKLETEVANAVSKIMENYMKSLKKEYVTVEGDTSSIVNQVLAQIKIPETGNSSSSMTKEEIEALVKQLVSNSVVSKNDVEKYKSTLVQETVTYLKSINLIKAGKDGKDGKDGINGKNGIDGEDGLDGLNGKDAPIPVKGIDYFTDEDIENIKSEIAKNGLRVYGIRGTGLSGDAKLDDKGNLVFTLEEYGDGSDIVPVGTKEMVVENVGGNSLVYMDIEKDDTASSDGNTVFKIFYYTIYQTDPSQNPNNPTNLRYYRESDGSIHTISDMQDGDRPVYRNEAGSITLNSVDEIVKEVKDRISKELAEQLGGEGANIEDLQKTIEEIKKQLSEINRKTDSLDKFTDDQKDENGYFTTQGSLQWTMQQIIHKSLTQKDLENIKESVRNDAGKLSTTTMIQVPVDDLADNGDGYYKYVHNGYTGINSRPGFSLVGTTAASIPDEQETNAWSYCKFIRVNSATAENAADGTIEFYFSKDEHADVKTYFSGKTLNVVFTAVDLDNKGTAVLTNQTRNNYGVVRIADQVDDMVIVTGYDTDTISSGVTTNGTGQAQKKAVYIEAIQPVNN